MQGKMGTVLWQKHPLLQSPPATWFTILFAAFLLLLAVPGNAAEQKGPEPQKPAVPAPPAVIPVAEIATQATEVSNLLRGFATNLAPGSAVETIRKNLPQVSANNDLELASSTKILKEQPSLETLQAQEQLWEQMQQQLTAWLKVLSDGADHQASECPEPAEDAAGSLDENPRRRAVLKRAGADPLANRHDPGCHRSGANTVAKRSATTCSTSRAKSARRSPAAGLY